MTAHELTYRTIDSPVGRLTLAGAGSTLLSLEFAGGSDAPEIVPGIASTRGPSRRPLPSSRPTLRGT